MNKTITVLEQSWMSLYVETFVNDAYLGSATAFVVEDKKKFYLITNRHVVTGRNNETGKCLSETLAYPNKIRVFCNHRSKDKSIHGGWGILEIKLFHDPEKENSHIWLEHPVLGDKADVIAIQINGLDNIEYCPYQLESDFDILLRPSDHLSVVGFPFGKRAHGYLAIWATGYLATDMDVDYDGLPIFLIDCRARSGQSGSPVIAHRNAGVFVDSAGNTNISSGTRTKLLGVYSGRINKESDFGFVWKTSLIKEIIQQSQS